MFQSCACAFSAPPQTPPEPPDSEAPQHGGAGDEQVDPADAVLTEIAIKSRRASMARVNSIPRCGNFCDPLADSALRHTHAQPCSSSGLSTGNVSS